MPRPSPPLITPHQQPASPHTPTQLSALNTPYDAFALSEAHSLPGAVTLGQHPLGLRVLTHHFISPLPPRAQGEQWGDVGSSRGSSLPGRNWEEPLALKVSLGFLICQTGVNQWATVLMGAIWKT